MLYLLWVAATIALLIALAVRSHGQASPRVEYCFHVRSMHHVVLNCVFAAQRLVSNEVTRQIHQVLLRSAH